MKQAQEQTVAYLDKQEQARADHQLTGAVDRTFKVWRKHYIYF